MAEATYTSSVLGNRGVNGKYATLRASAATTTSYVAGDHIDLGDMRRLGLLFTMTWVDSTSHTYYIEWSHDASNWFRSINVSTSAGVNTLTMNENLVTLGASTKWSDSVDKQARYARVAIKKTGGVGADAVGIIAEGMIY